MESRWHKSCCGEGVTNAAAKSRNVLELTPILGMCAVQTGGLCGLDFVQVIVEAAARRGPPSFQMAGLAETAVREARVRIASALSTVGISLDEHALTINLAPANLRKSGSGLDLAIALSTMGATSHLPVDCLEHALFFGEVSLDGAVRPIPGILPLLQGARALGTRKAFVPAGNASEAAAYPDLDVHAVHTLAELIDHLKDGRPLRKARPEPRLASEESGLTLEDVRGQAPAKRALLVAAAGRHNLLLVGPPGSGKSLLARRLPSLLPALTSSESLETTAIHSVAGVLDPSRGAILRAPFRAPHHTVSQAGLIGGGSAPRPGEISLAHHGVLFLDEMPEFRRGVLEALRQPLEDHEVSIVRARFQCRFPARPLLVGAMNPCPCGHYKNPKVACRCSPSSRARYHARISGPLLDRIDLQVFVPPVDLRAWTNPGAKQESLTTVEGEAQVRRARLLQLERQSNGDVRGDQNSLLTLQELERVAEPTSEAKKLLNRAVDKNLLSARGYVRVLRVARTLADLAQESQLRPEHIGEALGYRLPDLTEI